MPTTSNFGWTTPADTDLVKDGALAIRTLGNGIDTSMAQLKGGTTGQVLSKTSNTDMAFTWVTQDDANAIQNTIVDAKGDLISASGNDVPARLAVGSNGQTLVPDSAVSTGLKWSNNAPMGGLANISTTSLSGSGTVTVSNLGGYSRIHLIIDGASSASAGSTILLRFNSDTGNNYGYAGTSTTSTNTVGNAYTLAQGFWPIGVLTAAADNVSGFVNVYSAFSTGLTQINSGTTASGTNSIGYNVTGYYSNTGGITSLSVISSVGNFDAGTIYVRAA